MKACVELRFQKFVDRAVALQPGLACKGGGHNADAEMGFAQAVKLRVMAIACMMVAGVKMAFVDDFEPNRMQRRIQLLLNI